jgi:hypothetical protein
LRTGSVPKTMPLEGGITTGKYLALNLVGYDAQ